MKILVVDDNVSYLNVLGGLLKEYGYEVFLCEDGIQARELLEEEEPDFILSDVFMPGLDGCRFHSYVREFTESRDIPFIFVSAFDSAEMRKFVVNPKLDFFVSKTAPVEMITRLIETLRANLGPSVIGGSNEDTSFPSRREKRLQ